MTIDTKKLRELAEKVRDTLAAYNQEHTGKHWTACLDSEEAMTEALESETVLALLDEIDALQKDAARYRWLRGFGSVRGALDWRELGVDCQDLDGMDKTIDAALALREKNT